MTTPMDQPDADSSTPPQPGAPGTPGVPGPSPYAAPAALGGLAVSALVLGIVGLALATVPFLFWLGAMLGVVALVIGIVGLAQAEPGAGRGVAAVGIALGTVTLFVSAGWLVLLLFVAHAGDDTDETVPESEQASAAPGTPGAGALPATPVEPAGTGPAVLAFGETHAYGPAIRSVPVK
ncbi:DUF4190 domain-containing protein [Streptomyces sp. NPDC002825]|uniref:DUF4190 domain-containing protein n=1 Tax=Streptomyces sp. NPDC002825 TaxID=3154666 RepID=UPI00331F1F58